MKISFNGTVFSSLDTKTKNSSEGKNTFEETLQNQKNYHTNIKNSQTSTKTFFIDPISGQNVSVSLENSTIFKLQNQFGENSIIKNEAGDIELKDKAQDFVSGWFANIAYVREFLKADKNSDGFLSEIEYANTKNSYAAMQEISFAEKTFEVTTHLVANYINSSSQFNLYRNGEKVTSLDNELNHTLNLDKNFDGEISLEEDYQDEESMKQRVIDELKATWITSGYFKKAPSNIGEALALNYFNKALDFVLDKAQKGENIDEFMWDNVRKENNMRYDKDEGLSIDWGNSGRSYEALKKKNKDSHLAETLAQFIFMMIQAEAGINTKGTETENTSE